MSTKKPVADPDFEPECDSRDSVPNPYAERYREGHGPPAAPSGRIATTEDPDRLATKAEAGFDLATWTPRGGMPPGNTGISAG